MYKLFFIGLLVFVACQNEQQPAAVSSSTTASKPLDTNAGKKSIVFFGNSLTAAYQLSPEQGFPALIQQKIDSLQLPYRCINAGLSGETTADGVNRVNWVINQPVDIFVLELGGNDALRGLPIDASQKNLQQIITQVKTRYPSATIVLAGMKAPVNLGAIYTRSFEQMFSNLAQSNQLPLIPFLLEGVGGHPELNLPDGIHPNIAGQKIVAENVWTVLQPLLSKN